MFVRREYQLLSKNSMLLRNFVTLKKSNGGLLRRATRFFSTFEEAEEDSQNSADAFPMMNLVPEELLRDLTEKKRMKKIEADQPKKEISLTGIFPEIISPEL